MPQPPSIQDLQRAREIFEKLEPRDLFYRVAIEVVKLAWEGQSTLTIGEAVAVLLQTWNRAFYRYRKFDSQHFEAIEALLKKHKAVLHTLRQRSIEEFSPEDAQEIGHLFNEFDEVLGPVGAAKCLHLLAPRFFPLWDNAIAKAYGLFH